MLTINYELRIGSLPLPKKNRLTGKKDIDALFRQKNALKGDFLFIKYLKGEELDTRFVFLIPAKLYPKAVSRNRLRRILSGVIGINLNNINTGYNIAIVIKKRGNEDDFKKELLSLASKSNSLWKRH